MLTREGEFGVVVSMGFGGQEWRLRRLQFPGRIRRSYSSRNGIRRLRWKKSPFVRRPVGGWEY